MSWATVIHLHQVKGKWEGVFYTTECWVNSKNLEINKYC
jgi:hypothetical protein